jgi:hypothetical protein
MDILLLSQYFDTLSAVGANQMFLEHDPATVAKLQQSVLRSFLKTAEASSRTNLSSQTSEKVDPKTSFSV